jgi:hypothetical protein
VREAAKPTVRWRFRSENEQFHSSHWALNGGGGIIVTDPRYQRRGAKLLDDRVISILGLNKKPRGSKKKVADVRP